MSMNEVSNRCLRDKLDVQVVCRQSHDSRLQSSIVE